MQFKKWTLSTAASGQAVVCSPQYTEVWILKVNGNSLRGNYEKTTTLEGH